MPAFNSPQKTKTQTPGIAFFSGLRIKNRTTAMKRAIDARTRKKVDWSQMSQKTPICVSLFPIAVATNHPPIKSPRLLIGATLETSDSPIGESMSSPSVTTM